MTQSFDEWYRDTRDITAEAGWKAGAQSRQAEVDELQKRIDASLDELDIDLQSPYYDELKYIVGNAVDILKGEPNENQ